MTTITCALCSADRDVPSVHRCTISEEQGLVREAQGLSWGLIELSDNARILNDLIGIAGGLPLVVGGTVRDALISHFHGGAPQAPKSLDRQFIDTFVKHPDGYKRPGGPIAQDVDVEVHNLLDGGVMVNVLRESGFNVVEAGSRYPVYKVSRDGEQFDVSVIDAPFSDDAVLFDSFAARDFTVNAVGYDPFTGQFIDIYDGINDARDLTLNPTTRRFGEDPLRVLRAVQFISRYGFSYNDQLRSVGRGAALSFTTVAKERLWPEWKKLAQGTHIAAAWDAFFDLGLDHSFPEIAAIQDVPQDPHWHPEGPVRVHLGLAGDYAAKQCARTNVTGDQRIIVVLAALFHDLGKAGEGTQHVPQDDGTIRIRAIGHDEFGADAARSLLTSIGAPRHITDAIATIVREHMSVHGVEGEKPSLPASRRLYRRLGASMEMVNAWAMVCEADSQGRGPAAAPSRAYDWVMRMMGQPAASMTKPLLTGHDLISLGLEPTKLLGLFGTILRDALEAQDDGVFDTTNDAKAWVRAHADHYGISVRPDPFA